MTYSANAKTYTVDQQVAITCAAADEPRGSGIASTTCADIIGPAADFGLGVHDFSATATDYAGNTGEASGSFAVTVTPSSLCTLTKRYAQGSARYQAMTARQKSSVDKRLESLCDDALAAIAAGVTANKKKALASRYKDGVAQLLADGLLTQAQATQLSTFASAL